MTRKEVDEQMRVLVEYLRSKIDQRDWHAVCDAAMDLRELEVKKALMK